MTLENEANFKLTLLETQELNLTFLAFGNALLRAAQVTKERVRSGDVGRGQIGVACWAITRLGSDDVVSVWVKSTGL